MYAADKLLPFLRCAVPTLIVPLVTAVLVLVDEGGPFGSAYFGLESALNVSDHVLRAYGADYSESTVVLTTSARSNVIRFSVTTVIFYIIVPLHVGISEYRARVLFHIQNLLRKENRLLEQTPTWKPAKMKSNKPIRTHRQSVPVTTLDEMEPAFE
mgnify:FL=1